MKHKPIDVLMLILVASVIIALALLNVFQTDRPTVSESENRNLAAWPEFKIADVASGKYFSDIGAFFSDTFFEREALVNFSKQLDQLKGLFDDDFSVIINPNPTNPTDPEDDTLPTLPPLTQPSDPSTAPSEPSTVPSTGTQPGTEPTESKPPVIPISLDASKASLTVGAAKMLTATIGDGYGSLTWSTDNSKVASVTDNGDGTANVKALAAGTASISATVQDANGEKVTCVCIITVTAPSQGGVNDDAAAFLPNGLFIYKGAAYSQSYFNKTYSTKLGEIYERFAALFPNAKVSAMTAPLATITISDSDVAKKISDQGAILDKIQGVMPSSINFVNLKDTFKAHASEYLFFKSDHHWTQRGAYYAYAEFVKSLGMTPTPIEDFQVKVLSTTWNGSMYNYTKDERVKNFKDTVEAYIPTKACTMTIGSKTYDSCINLSGTSYTAFIRGDNGYTVINVPENPQDKTILVFKDSYGNALVPFLTENFGNIIVVDARYIELKAVDTFKDMNITDILFMSNTSTMTKSWYNKYYKMIT